jgi:flagellar basal body-associated protein FliL
MDDPNPTNVNPNTALPNSYGKVRTMKEDYDDFRTGKLQKDQGSSPGNDASVSGLEITAPQSKPVEKIGFDQKSSLAIPPETKTEPPKPAGEPVFSFRESEKKEEKNETLNPFGSQSFFNGKSPFEEESQTALPQKQAEAASKGTSRKTLTILFSTLFALAIVGGGFYYYWFFIKKSPANDIQIPAQTKTIPEAAQEPTAQPANKNLRYLNVDPIAGKEANQQAFRSLAENFLSGASENDLIEIKVLDKNNQPMQIRDFETGLGFSLPDNLLLKITSDYSLFMKKENSKAHVGAAFKLSETAGLLDELSQQEKNLPLQLLPFYLNQAPTEAAISFNSSKYKNADIRYSNFPEATDTSLDYSILTDKQNGYFIFATSKNSIRSILDYMWGK